MSYDFGGNKKEKENNVQEGVAYYVFNFCFGKYCVSVNKKVFDNIIMYVNLLFVSIKKNKCNNK